MEKAIEFTKFLSIGYSYVVSCTLLFVCWYKTTFANLNQINAIYSQI